MEKFIPLGKFYPYTSADLSVVVPHATRFYERLVWFLKQYVAGTPPEVVKNTIIGTDPKDDKSLALIKQYGLQYVFTEIDWSTYKRMAGFEKVRTRLCVRMDNDTRIVRDDWVQVLLERFNGFKQPQLIGEWHNSGYVAVEHMQRIQNYGYPFLKDIISDTEKHVNDNGVETMEAHYINSFFMAGQSFIFKQLYKELMEINENKMEKEDLILSHLVSLNNIHISRWRNMGLFCNNMSHKVDAIGQSQEVPMPIKVTPELAENTLPKAIFDDL